MVWKSPDWLFMMKSVAKVFSLSKGSFRLIAIDYAHRFEFQDLKRAQHVAISHQLAAHPIVICILLCIMWHRDEPPLKELCTHERQMILKYARDVQSDEFYSWWVICMTQLYVQYIMWNMQISECHPHFLSIEDLSLSSPGLLVSKVLHRSHVTVRSALSRKLHSNAAMTQHSDHCKKWNPIKTSEKVAVDDDDVSLWPQKASVKQKKRPEQQTRTSWAMIRWSFRQGISVFDWFLSPWKLSQTSNKTQWVHKSWAE